MSRRNALLTTSFVLLLLALIPGADPPWIPDPPRSRLFWLLVFLCWGAFCAALATRKED